MLQKFNIVIADTTCFIILDKIGKLDLLRELFQQITTTPTIANEFGKPLPDWVNIISVGDAIAQTILEIEVDEGEASAIALALETDNALLVLDDLKGRKLADKLNLTYTGTFGLLLKAKEEGIIKSIKPILTLIQATNFRFSATVILGILKQANEE
jgi:predicted nucleic acid-binding protein